jgi:glycosyltransferase involved in cell wall biosynthesis
LKDLISVVIPTYNRADDLKKAIESVINQTYADWELLVIDNHSTDHTREIIDNINDKRIRLFEIDNQGVIAASRNLGINNSKGKYVAFLDSDDIWTEDKLEKSMFWLNQGYDVVYHDMDIVSNNFFYFGPHQFTTRKLEQPVYSDLLVNGNTLPTSSVVVEKGMLLKANGFNESIEFIAGEDYDLWIRLSEMTQRFKKVDGTLGNLSKGNDNEFSSLRLILILSELQKKYISRLSPSEQAQAYLNWIEYAYGRSLYNQKKFKKAKNHLLKVYSTSNKITYRIKAFYMLSVIAFRKVISFTL